MSDKTDFKRKQILNAALECFLQNGYSKSTFKDVAKRAGISRASLYLYFKNRKDLFITINKEHHDERFTKSREILRSNLNDKEKLQEIINVWIVDPYLIITNTPYPNDWLDELKYISEQSEMRFRELFIKSIEPLVGEGLASVIVLAIRGLMDDRPPVQILKKRIEILIEKSI